MKGERSIEDYQQQIRDLVNERDWDRFHDPKNLAIGLATEAAELLQCFRFLDEEGVKRALKDPEAYQKIAEEVADSWFFMLRLIDKLEIDLAQVFDHKMRTNAAKYPSEKVRGKVSLRK